jgi:thiol-disulfide isomerase/thioredoxin
MKKILVVILLVLSNQLSAQTFRSFTNAPTLGNVCPEFSLSTITPNGSEKLVSLNDYRGKVIIIEFWATYCKPCIPSLSHFDKMQARFGDQIKIFAVSEEDRDKVDAFRIKRPLHNVTFVMDWGRKINDLFYHHFIPHTVIIDQEGIVRAFTSPDEIDDLIVQKLINKEEVAFVMKQEYQDASYTQSASITTVSNVSNVYDQPTIIQRPKNTVYKVELSQYRPNESTQFVKESESEYKFINCPLSLMYQVLHNRPTSRIVFDVADPNKYNYDPQNLYCLEVNVPDFTGKNVNDIGIQQLETLFPLRSKIETRNRKVFAIQKSEMEGATSSIDSTGIIQKGLTIKDLMNYLESNPHLVQNLPVVNDSGLPDNTLIDLDWLQNYPDAIENKLRTLGLKNEIKMMDIESLILFENRLMSKNE